MQRRAGSAAVARRLLVAPLAPLFASLSPSAASPPALCFCSERVAERTAEPNQADVGAIDTSRADHAVRPIDLRHEPHGARSRASSAPAPFTTRGLTHSAVDRCCVASDCRADPCSSSAPSLSRRSMSTALDQFHSRLSSLCVAAGPPAPSFSTADIESALACVTTKDAVAPGFAAIDARLSADLSSTPLSVRSMLWELLVRACDRSAAQTIAQGGRDEWSVVVAPHLYRIVMLVVPKAEDAAANVPLAKQTLRRWMAAAEANSAAASSTAAVPAPFKKPQLINALKYVEGYVYEPPRRSESELIASREAKRERKRQRRKEEAEREERRRHAKANGRRKRSRSRSSHSSGSRSGSITPGSAAAASSNNAAAAAGGAAVPPAHSPSRSVSDGGGGGSSRSNSSSRSPSASPSSRRRYRNRSAVSHTASEEAYASRFLEQLRASQKRAHVEGSLRADNDSMQGWEEWAETIDYIREGEKQQRAAEREAAAAAAAAAAATAAANLAAASSSPASAAFPSAPFSAPSPSAASASSSSLSSFLSHWLSARNHWKPLRDDVGQAEGTPSEGGQHQMDQWLAYYSAAGLPLPSSLIPGGATRLWSVLNENAASAKFQGPLLPPPIPKSALALYDKYEAAAATDTDATTKDTATAMRI